MALLSAVCSALWLSSSLALSSRSDYAARFYMLRRGQPHVRKNRRETTKFRAQKIAIKYFCIELDCALVSTARNLWNTVIWTAHFAWPTCTVTRLSQHEHSPLYFITRFPRPCALLTQASFLVFVLVLRAERRMKIQMRQVRFNRQAEPGSEMSSHNRRTSTMKLTLHGAVAVFRFCCLCQKPF